jgi:hypothetical protein
MVSVPDIVNPITVSYFSPLALPTKQVRQVCLCFHPQSLRDPPRYQGRFPPQKQGDLPQPFRKASHCSLLPVNLNPVNAALPPVLTNVTRAPTGGRDG